MIITKIWLFLQNREDTAKIQLLVFISRLSADRSQQSGCSTGGVDRQRPIGHNGSKIVVTELVQLDYELDDNSTVKGPFIYYKYSSKMSFGG